MRVVPKITLWISLLAIAGVAIALRPPSSPQEKLMYETYKNVTLAQVPGAKQVENSEYATFAAGCFWGVEENFRRTKGVLATAVGYTGGKTENPTYRQVCGHGTGHAEAVLVKFDPAQISYESLVERFFALHDPTQWNRQGPDVGDQYRSEIFTHSDEQAKVAKEVKERIAARASRPIATLVEPAPTFWPAEEYHQQYVHKGGAHACPID